jgi:hypothetical protein
MNAVKGVDQAMKAMDLANQCQGSVCPTKVQKLPRHVPAVTGYRILHSQPLSPHQTKVHYFVVLAGI